MRAPVSAYTSALAAGAPDGHEHRAATAAAADPLPIAWGLMIWLLER